MCDPATAMTAFKVVSGVASFAQGQQQARDQNARAEANRISATDARDLKIRQLALRSTQEQEKANEEKRTLSLEALRKEATARVSAGEANVGGQSFDALIREYDADLLRGLQKISKDADAVNYQLSMERQGLEAETLNRIASIQPVDEPSPFMAAVGIAGDAFATNSEFGGTALEDSTNYLYSASGLQYDTGFFTDQSRMLAEQGM